MKTLSMLFVRVCCVVPAREVPSRHVLFLKQNLIIMAPRNLSHVWLYYTKSRIRDSREGSLVR